jgi:hypothetical protein
LAEELASRKGAKAQRRIVGRVNLVYQATDGLSFQCTFRDQSVGLSLSPCVQVVLILICFFRLLCAFAPLREDFWSVKVAPVIAEGKAAVGTSLPF